MRLSYRPLPDEDPLAAYRELAERLERLEERDDSGGEGRAKISLGTSIPSRLNSEIKPSALTSLAAKTAVGRTGWAAMTDSGSAGRM